MAAACPVLHLLTNATHPLCQLIFYSCSTALLNSSGEPERGKQASTAVTKLRVSHQLRSTLLSSKRSCRTARRKSFRLEPDPIKVVSLAGETINAHYKACLSCWGLLGPGWRKTSTSDSDCNWRRQLFPPEQSLGTLQCWWLSLLKAVPHSSWVAEACKTHIQS